jgi:succinate-semialdehyde dehydrogenase
LVSVDFVSLDIVSTVSLILAFTRSKPLIGFKEHQMDNKAYIDGLIKKSRAAQKQIESCDQKTADKMVKAIGKAISQNSEILSKEAVEETGMGVYASKVRKHKAAGIMWWYLKDKVSVGVVSTDPVNGLVTIAKPMGVVACISPSTNPTFTPALNSMMAIKSRNSVIVAPHPKAKKCTTHAVKIMQDALESVNAPRDLVLVIEEPTVELSGLLMATADVVVATGGFGMVKAAYSSGKPSYGVGQGNVQVIIDEGYEDIPLAVANIIANRSYDLGVPCTCDQSLYIPRSSSEKILKAFTDSKAHIISGEDILEKLRKLIFINGVPNRDVVGQSPYRVCKMIGLDIPETTTILMTELKKYGPDETLCHEIMFPFTRYFIYDDFKKAVEMAKTNLLMAGAGHTSVLYSTNEDRILYAGDELPVGRLLICQAGSGGAGNSWANGLTPTSSVGCGSWGNNSTSININYQHFLNYTIISKAISPHIPSDEELWA